MKKNQILVLSTALAAAHNGADGAIVQSATLGGGLRAPFNSSADWDVDGDGTSDFRLFGASVIYTTTFFTFPVPTVSGGTTIVMSTNTFPVATISIGSMNELNGGRFVAPLAAVSDGIAKLPSGILVGPTMTNYKFFPNAQTAITMTSYGSVGADASQGGWSVPTTGFFGFRFTSGPDTYYGWGVMTLDGQFGGGFRIDEAYYESTPGAAITVGTIPEPRQVATGLAALALGAAGVRRWRRTRAARQVSSEESR